ncbi:sirohydrochlorin chelatase [Streptomyces sp. NBC_00876]|uniref:sirohydrochlorin chelatase n=1 Tax=Streptomyces sp. NBC_00876 TaxID=2975853 RepID=UPI0038706F6F|nr:sirohydrochlorin chelatase [Streptomyces sp. NBC_00876]
MTESAPERPPDSLPIDSTAQLLTRITAQLGTQLSLVSLNGTRRPMHRTRQQPPYSDVSPLVPAAPALVAVAHGSRDPQALRTVTELLDRVRELRPGLDVRLGHIELNAPLLPQTLDGLGSGEAVLVPLLLGRGHHVKQDIPRAVAGAPALRTRTAAPLGPHPLLVEALHGRLTDAGWRSADDGNRNSAVVLAAAGSRDPESAADTRRTAQLLSERLGGVPVLPAYASAATPTVAAALRALAARGRRRVAVASYFTAPGRFASAAAAAAPWIAAAPLGAHPAMARLLLHRYDQARAGGAPAHETLMNTRFLASA